MARASSVSEAMVEEALRLRRADPGRWTFQALSDHFGCNCKTLHGRVQMHGGREYKAKPPEAPRDDSAAFARRAARRALELADTRDFTARFFGDPLPGESALDRMRGGAT